MARLKSLSIRNYRSISTQLEVAFPSPGPLVLVGENNAGKSNIVKALELLLGPFWPNNHQPDDNEFYDRDTTRVVEVVGRFSDDDLLNGRYHTLRWSYDHSVEPPVFYKGAPGLYEHLYGFVSGADRDACTCIVLEADRNLKYHLGYASKWTFLSRLMHRFHSKLRDYPEIKEDLERSFDQIKQSFERIPEFETFSTSLQEHFTQLVGSMSHRLDVSFEAYNPANFFQALRLEASEGGSPRALAEMGTGEQQVLAMAFAHAFARAFHGGIILVIEEPEAHLHPLAQQWLATQLSDMCEGGLQVIITTHGPAFVDVLNLQGIALVRKGNEGTTITQRTVDQLVEHCVASGAPAARTTVENVLPFYRSNATSGILEGFFAKVVVLVEGPTEALSLPIYLGKHNLEVAREGISIIGVQGKGNLAKWRRLFTLFMIPCYVVFDNDPGDDGTGSKRRDALRAVGIQAANTEDFIQTADWIVEDEVSVFGKDFETALRQAFPGYAALEAQAATEGVDSKPFKARYVAEHLIIDDAAGWRQIARLAEKLAALANQRTTEPPPAVPVAPDDELPF